MKPTILAPVLAGLAALMLLGQALASDLYVGETTLEEDQAVTAGALLEALDQVLVRLTGMVEESPVATIGLRGADVNALVLSQQRVRIERIDEDAEPVSQLRLRAEFHPPSVDRLLQDHELPRWGRERPAILLWVAEENEDGVRLASDPYMEQVVAEQSRRFGLDVIRPLGDALDMAEVDLADIRGGFLDAAENGLQRYRAGLVAMLDLRAEDDYWSGRWFWRLEGRDGGLSLTADTQAEIIESGLAGLLSTLTARYAIIADELDRGTRRVVVDGIVDPVQYAEIVAYLEQLDLVEELRLVRARDRRVEFDLAVSGGRLEDVIALSRLLRIEQQEFDGTLYLKLR
jgi:uncharacterized protein